MKTANGFSSRNEVTTTGQRVVHAKIAEVARAAAGELYESMMSSNTFYDEWRKQNPGCSPKELEDRFIRKNWGQCIDFARTTLTIMLTKDDVSEEMKEEIMKILEQDYVLRNRRVVSPPLRKAH